MNTSASLPLSQQILAWLLKSMGFAEAHYPGRHASPSTLKNAQRGQPIPERWEALIRDALMALRAPVDEDRLRHFMAQLRRWDREAGALPVLPLSPKLRYSPALRRLAVELGVRCGVVGALLSLQLRPALRPQIHEALSAPLSPAFFGRVVLLLLQHHKPEWDTWERREEGLEGVVSARTLERWHTAQALRVPAPKKILELVGAMKLPEDAHHRALMALRFARALSYLRQDSKRWVGAERQAELAALTGRFAARSLAVLSRADNLQAVAREVADLLETQAGPNIVHNFLPPVPEAKRPELAARAAEVLREEAAGWDSLESGRVDKLWLLLMQLLEPTPGLMRSVFAGFGGDLVWLAHLRPLAAELQMYWQSALLLDQLAQGATLEWERGAPWTPPPAVRAHAQDALARLSALSVPPPEPGQVDPLMTTLATVLAQTIGVEHMQETLNAAFGVPAMLRAMPSGMEALLADEELAQAPNLMPARALRLVQEGDLQGGAAWLARWKATPHLKDPWELKAAAEAHAAFSHVQLDNLAESIGALHRLRAQLRALEEEDAWVRYAHKAGHMAAKLETSLETLDGLMALIERLLPAGHADEVTSALLTLPVRARLDQLQALLDQAEVVLLVRATPQARGLPALLDRHPEDGRLYALQAMWQELTGEPARVARRLAAHHGCGALLERLRVQVGLSEKDGGEAEASR